MKTEREAQPGRSETLWKGVALAALALCLALALGRGGTPALADNGGASSAGIITMMGVNPGVEHLYVVDTSKRTILMYESRSAADLSLVAGRNFSFDTTYLEGQPGRYLKYNAQGYDAKVGEMVAKELAGYGRP